MSYLTKMNKSKNSKQKVATSKDDPVKVERRCGEIFMTQDRFLMFHCEDCDMKTNNFGGFLNHLKGHWTRYDVKPGNPRVLVQELKKWVPQDAATETELKDGETDITSELMVGESISDDQQIQQEDDEEILDLKEEFIALESNPLHEQEEEETKSNNERDSKPRRKTFEEYYIEVKKEQQQGGKNVANTQGVVFPCSKCDLFFYSAHRLNLHEKTHSDERKYKCRRCGFAFKEESNLRVHLRRHAGKKRFTCSHCPKMFHTRSEMLTHERRHTGERPFICSQCGLAFISSGALNEHIKRHDNKRPHKCERCEKTFFDSYQLKMHMIVHTRERKFPCKVCAASFARLQSLKSHMKIHENKREYVCDAVGCKAAFNQRPSLVLHMKKKHKIESNTVARIDSKKQTSAVVIETLEAMPSASTTEGMETPSSDMIIDDGVPTCTRCNIGFETMADLVLHVEEVHDGLGTMDEVIFEDEEQIEEITDVDTDDVPLQFVHD